MAIEVVFEDGGDRRVGMGTDLERPFAGGLQSIGAMAAGQAEDADGRAEALFGVGPIAHDEVDEDLAIGSLGGGHLADALRRPRRMAAV